MCGEIGAYAGIHLGVCVVACLVRQDPSSHVNKTLWVGRAYFLCAFTHLGMYICTEFKRQVCGTDAQ